MEQKGTVVAEKSDLTACPRCLRGDRVRLVSARLLNESRGSL
jgi:hypothetical protein